MYNNSIALNVMAPVRGVGVFEYGVLYKNCTRLLGIQNYANNNLSFMFKSALNNHANITIIV